MPNKYQQPSFKFETNKATYDVQYFDVDQGDERWFVSIVYKSSEKITGVFNLPINWSREMVFGWLSRMELTEIGRGE